jgi:hypothetical protein
MTGFIPKKKLLEEWGINRDTLLKMEKREPKRFQMETKGVAFYKISQIEEFLLQFEITVA